MDEPEEDPADRIDAVDDPAVRAALEALRRDLDDRTVPKERLEADLRRYVRRRLRAGHARGWGPYVVLLYGVTMTVGAFYFLSGGWAVLAMIVIWLSTLGLYVLMVVLGLAGALLGGPRRAVDAVRERRR